MAIILLLSLTFSSEWEDLILAMECELLGVDAVVAVPDMLLDFRVPNVLAVSLL